jgi:hypothetical protein
MWIKSLALTAALVPAVTGIAQADVYVDVALPPVTVSVGAPPPPPPVVAPVPAMWRVPRGPVVVEPAPVVIERRAPPAYVERGGWQGAPPAYVEHGGWRGAPPVYVERGWRGTPPVEVERCRHGREHQHHGRHHGHRR